MTLHISAISPHDATDALVAALTGTDGVARLAVLPGAGRPAGDLVQFDVAPAAANAVLTRLRELAVPASVHTIDAATGAGRGRRGLRLLARDLPPVWDLIEARIRADAVYAPSFYLLLLFAGLIAATGILTNSQILIVGAMVVGPEYSAIMGVALGLDQGDRQPVATGLLALLAGFGAAIAGCLAFGLCVRGLGRTPHLYSVGVRPVSELINSPNLFSVLVAIFAAIVGVVSLTEARAGALIGVFISVTTIPAAADIGLSAAYGSWNQTTGALLQLVLNAFVLTAIGAAGLRLQRWLWRGRDRRAKAPPAAS